MSRNVCRVVLVSFFALSLTLAVTPAVQAVPRDSPVQTRSWFEEAKEWLSRLLESQEKRVAKLEKPDIRVTHSGPCIDPLGRPKPCP